MKFSTREEIDEVALSYIKSKSLFMRLWGCMLACPVTMGIYTVVILTIGFIL
jgi:hypothetical protein|tara:strand:- start:53 stop:208 length:156 start_codon:yes stop_codon:yes gene_type:complete